MIFDTLSDEQLILKTRSGDQKSVEELIRRYKTTVKSIAHRFYLIGAENEDLIQEGMVALFLAIDSYDASKKASFKTFASICIRRQIIDAVKKANKQGNLHLNESRPFDENLSLTMESLDEEPLSLLLYEESFLNLISDINSILSPKESRIFSLYIQGMTYNEIAVAAAVSFKKVDNTLQKCRKFLKSDYLAKK